MAWKDVSDRSAILRAVREYDALGAEGFYAKYGFGPPRTQALIIDGKEYPSKAILGVAHGFEFPALGFLTSEDFTGGEHTVRARLTKLGFEVRPPREAGDSGTALLTPGRVYTRNELRDLFGIVDATINNGVFPHKPTEVWLFVTEKKTPDRTQFQDRLVGDTLYWDGQSSGRTDHHIIDHASNGAQLLVFYRTSRYEYPGAGFRYEGPFIYREHAGARPAHFILERATAAEAGTDVSQAVEQYIRARVVRSRRSAAELKAIERHAVDIATAYYEPAGWIVQDVGDTHSYDLRCTREGIELHVEVKGTTAPSATNVVLTRNEVRHARQFDQVALFVVVGIKLQSNEDGTPACDGGIPVVLEPWKIDEGNLDPLAYDYELPILAPSPEA